MPKLDIYEELLPNLDFLTESMLKRVFLKESFPKFDFLNGSVPKPDFLEALIDFLKNSLISVRNLFIFLRYPHNSLRNPFVMDQPV